MPLKTIQDEIIIIRVLFFLFATWLGYRIGAANNKILEYTLASMLIAGFFVLFEFSTFSISTKKITLAAFGLLFGLMVANYLYRIIPASVMDVQQAQLICYLFCGYMGIMLSLKNVDRFDPSKLNFIVSHPQSKTFLLDTSVIIDGRIQELLLQGFISGQVMVPEFVINELQTLADSGDANKRAKGRRGLEILDQLRNAEINVNVWEKDFPDEVQVDQKLVQLSQQFGCTLVTNDFNLQRVAQVHDIRVLNLNELANSLKPSTFIGENISVFVNKEGKEAGQGVGYLEDGTMIVIEDGRKYIGSVVQVDVTSILNTTAGRMIFARLHEVAQQRRVAS